MKMKSHEKYVLYGILSLAVVIFYISFMSDYEPKSLLLQVPLSFLRFPLFLYAPFIIPVALFFEAWDEYKEFISRS